MANLTNALVANWEKILAATFLKSGGDSLQILSFPYNSRLMLMVLE